MLYAALRRALSGTGPAIFAGASTTLPTTVPHRVAVVVQSSGSTERPKRVAISADALLANAAATESAIGGPGQWLLALDTDYIAGVNVLVRSIAAGTEPVVVSNVGFSAERFVDAASQLDHPLRFTALVPAQLSRLIAAREATAVLRRFDRILVGGQASPPALLERAADLGLAVTRTYGSSETSGGCVYDGLPIGSTRLRVVDGEVQISGPTLAEGYLDDPERTGAAFIVEDGQRWYRTGDAGALGDGLLTISGRLDDIIISGGVKVSLGELERLVQAATPLSDAVVVSVDDERWGQVPVVVSTETVELAELRAIARQGLGVAAAPARLVVVPVIPYLPSGKPDRLAIRAGLDR